jgi:hypothetical protein
MAEIYRHIRLDNNDVFYIGIGKTKYRAYSKEGRNKYWHNIVNKTGYEVQILKKDLDYSDAKELEKILISYYGRNDKGLGTLANMTDGGEGTIGRKDSEDTLNKKRISMIGKNLGNIPNEATRKKIGEKSKQRIRSIESRIKQSKSKMGSNNSMSIQVLNIATGIYYDTLKDAANSINMNRNKFRMEINNKNIPFVSV